MTHPTDDEIMKLAGEWFHTGENQKRDDGYYYRSLGTPSNVRGSDLIEFARALLAEQARPTKRKTYKPGNGGTCSICGQPEGDHYKHGNDCPDMRGVEQST